VGVFLIYYYILKRDRWFLLKTIPLSNRLQKAAEHTVVGKAILDVGSDHAYLPIYLIQQGKIPFAIAGEVAQGPYHNAQKQVAYYSLHDNISVRFGDGLAVLRENETVGTIFICGMGGLLILDILRDAQPLSEHTQKARLVLQPNTKERELRQWLSNNRYRIIEEAVVEEKNKLYEIIVAEKASHSVHYSKEELTFGPILLKKKSPTFLKKWQKALATNETILMQLKNTNNKEKQKQILEKIEQIKKVIL